AYEHKLTLLMWAAGQGHSGAIRLLLDRDARTDLLDDRGMTASDIARGAGHGDVAEAAGLR
nr:hypothetical protein [Lautropia sp.]